MTAEQQSCSVGFTVSHVRAPPAFRQHGHVSAKHVIHEVGSWFNHSQRRASFEFSFSPDGESASLLTRGTRRHASKPQSKPESAKTQRPSLPWASLSFSLPNLQKQKPASAQKQPNLGRKASINFQSSSAHTLPPCISAGTSLPAAIPSNKRRCIPWHQAEFSMSTQPRQQPMLASLTSACRPGNNSQKPQTLLSTTQTARQHHHPDSCSSTRHQHSPFLCLADAASRAADEEAEEILLTRTRDISLTVKDRLKAWSRRMPNQMRRLVAGAVAGALSKTAIAPIETIRMQVMGGKGDVMESIARTWGKKGVLGFFNGNSADILRVMPSKAIELSAFDAYKKFLSHHDEHGELKRPGPLLTGLAGAAAGMTATLGLYPLETLRTRLAMGDYDNMLHAVRAVAAEEGLMAFYQGISASLIGILPYAAIRLGVYDGLKWSHKKFKKEDHIPALNTALYGAFAGLVSATATFPVEVVRRRMMVGTVKGGTWKALTMIAKNEGWKSLYKGIGLTWAKQAPQYAVTFLAYDLIKEYLEV